MQQQLQITFRGLPPSDAIEAKIRDKVSDLDQFCDSIISCHVLVEAPHQRHRQGTMYVVRVDARVPGGEVIVNQDRGRDHSHEDVYVAIRDAFDAVVRQLEDYARRRRGDSKIHETPLWGTIRKIFRRSGYGFVETSDGVDVYFHKNAVVGSFATLEIGDSVRISLAEGEGRKGPQASSVTPLTRSYPIGASRS